jgi:hypothetical protein
MIRRRLLAYIAVYFPNFQLVDYKKFYKWIIFRKLSRNNKKRWLMRSRKNIEVNYI